MTNSDKIPEYADLITVCAHTFADGHVQIDDLPMPRNIRAISYTLSMDSPLPHITIISTDDSTHTIEARSVLINHTLRTDDE